MLITTTTRSACVAAAILAATVALFSSPAQAFDYTPVIDCDDCVQVLTDTATGIEELKTIFVGDETLVRVDNVEWIHDGEGGSNSTSGGILKWETSVNGIVQDSGEIDLSEYDRQLPTTIEAGSIQIDKSKLFRR